MPSATWHIGTWRAAELLASNTDRAVELASIAGSQGDQEARSDGAASLRRLRTQRPDLADDIDRVLDVLT